jgi:hypothetical protein
VIRGKMPPLDPASLLLRQLCHLCGLGPPTHREALFRMRPGSRLEVLAVDDRPKSQTSAAIPAEPGDSQFRDISFSGCRLLRQMPFCLPRATPEPQER